eukprot:5069214-Pyramimonas_sp.AAC.1
MSVLIPVYMSFPKLTCVSISKWNLEDVALGIPCRCECIVTPRLAARSVLSQSFRLDVGARCNTRCRCRFGSMYISRRVLIAIGCLWRSA